VTISIELTEHKAVRSLRAALRTWLDDIGLAGLSDRAELAVAELATNALLYGGEWAQVSFLQVPHGIRLEVRDRTRTAPIVGWASERSMTGRGLSLVHAITDRFGVESTEGGKVVWAELEAFGSGVPSATQLDWGGPDASGLDDRPTYSVSLGDVPTDLLLDAKSHVDNLVREFTLAAAGARAGQTAAIPSHLAALIETVVERFAVARTLIKRQALRAAHAGASHTTLELRLPADAAIAGEDYLRALDEADEYCRAQRFLTLETPPQHRVFRQWYVGEIIAQLRAAVAGAPQPVGETFERRLLRELDRVAEARRASDRAARLFAVTGALVSAASPEEVADAVLEAGVAALGASGGGLLLVGEHDGMVVPGTLGYGQELVARLRAESTDAELPAALALRTGEPVWVESREQRDAQFPDLLGLERETVAVCAVPLVVRGQRLGALRFSFNEPRLFGEDERRFVMALAAQGAQALDRAQLQHERVEVSHRLQRSLLPPVLPDIPGIEVAAMYHPLGRGIEVGGDFYDMWPVGPGRWALAIGDAAGTGPEAAAISAQVRHTLRALAMSDRDPASVLRNLNNALLTGAVGRAFDDTVFCTAIFGLLEVGDHVALDLVTGGHPPPVVRSKDGTVVELALQGSLLGVLPEIAVVSHHLILEPGSSVVLFTDGLLESRNDDGDFFDLDRVQEVVRDAPDDAMGLVNALELAVLKHTSQTLEDDVAVLVVRVRP